MSGNDSTLRKAMTGRDSFVILDKKCDEETIVAGHLRRGSNINNLIRRDVHGFRLLFSLVL
jgi:hypothetical protein